VSLRVVLYAEGSGETAGSVTMLPAPGATLTPEMLGPGHLLIGRAIERVWNLPLEAVRFESPLRTARGTVAHGSDLHERTSLRRLLTWARPRLRPELVVVLVDEDGDRSRKSRLVGHTEDLPCTRVIAVAVREFEAWLLADEAALREVLGCEVATVATPEDLSRGEAKQLFNELCDVVAVDGNRKAHHHACRHSVSRTADLDALARRCRSFALFLEELRAVRR
jgi:hypothetical protein